MRRAEPRFPAARSHPLPDGAGEPGTLVGQRHFGVDPRKYKHDAQASVFARKALTRLRFVLVWPTKVALSNHDEVYGVKQNAAFMRRAINSDISMACS